MAMILRERDSKRDRASEVARDLLGSSAGAETTQAVAVLAGCEGPDVRTCTHCGEHVPFRIDPLGSWAECPVCGRLN
jgi:hypothetical protein